MAAKRRPPISAGRRPAMAGRRVPAMEAGRGPAISAAGIGQRLLRSRVLEALACPHGIDRYVELLRPLAVTREVRAEITRVCHQTPKSVTLTVRPNHNWRGLRAGQFVGLSVDIDGVRETRPYSPSGSQHAAEGELELTVSTHPEGKVSRYLRDHARPGMILGLTGAEGSFVLPELRPERVLLVSGGSGITPVMAMLRTLCDEGFPGEVGFLNYARSPELALYGDELDRLAAAHRNVRVARGFTRDGGRALAGRFCREHLRAVSLEHAAAATFVCGPPALIESVRAIWAHDGLPEPAVEAFARPAVEGFAGPAVEASARPMIGFDTEDAAGTVSFCASGRTAANSGLPLLEQAEDAGLDPAHGCRMGICNTCSCRKTEGTVSNLLTGEVSTAGEQQIRICVSVPLGDVTLEL
jgi:ferredoxin-NADP reductase